MTMKVPLRDAWNAARVKTLGQQTKRPVYVLKAMNTANDIPVTARVAAHLAARHPDQKDRDIAETLYLVVGMECMIVKNVHTSLGVANGSRGVIVGVELHIDDAGLTPDNNVSLHLTF